MTAPYVSLSPELQAVIGDCPSNEARGYLSRRLVDDMSCSLRSESAHEVIHRERSFVANLIAAELADGVQPAARYVEAWAALNRWTTADNTRRIAQLRGEQS